MVESLSVASVSCHTPTVQSSLPVCGGGSFLFLQSQLVISADESKASVCSDVRLSITVLVALTSDQARVVRCPCPQEPAVVGRCRGDGSGPPRTAAGDCPGSGWTAEGGRCHLIGHWQATGVVQAPPGPIGAGWVRGQGRGAGADPSSRRPPPHTMAATPGRRPPLGPAGLRNGDCRTQEDGLMDQD